MAMKKKLSRHIMLPEYAKMPHDKEMLVKSINAQRQRLMAHFPASSTKDEMTDKEYVVDGQQNNFSESFAGADDTFPRSKTMQVLLKRPELAAAAGIGLVLVVWPLYRKLGGKTLLRWAGVLSPLVLKYLEKGRGHKN